MGGLVALCFWFVAPTAFILHVLTRRYLTVCLACSTVFVGILGAWFLASGAGAGCTARDAGVLAVAFVLALITSVLVGLPILLLRLPPTGIPDTDSQEPQPGITVPCPHCGRVNSVQSRVCPRCERRLAEQDERPATLAESPPSNLTDDRLPTQRTPLSPGRFQYGLSFLFVVMTFCAVVSTEMRFLGVGSICLLWALLIPLFCLASWFSRQQ